MSFNPELTRTDGRMTRRYFFRHPTKAVPQLLARLRFGQAGLLNSLAEVPADLQAVLHAEAEPPTTGELNQYKLIGICFLDAPRFIANRRMLPQQPRRLRLQLRAR